jgi:26S proteasome regulatory subunit N8
VIVDAKPRDLGLPTDSYYAVEEVHDDGTPTTKTFEHVASEIGAEEAEEVGVEHLLRLHSITSSNHIFLTLQKLSSVFS